MGTQLILVLPKNREKQKKIMNEMWNEHWKRLVKNFDYNEEFKRDTREEFFSRFDEKSHDFWFSVFRSTFSFIDWTVFHDLFGPEDVITTKTENKKKLLEILKKTKDRMISSKDEEIICDGKNIEVNDMLLVEFAIKYDLSIRISY